MYVNRVAAPTIGEEANVYLADKMVAAGADLEDVYQQTGWFPGPDGMMRTEIDDRGFTFTDEFLADGGPMRLEDAVEHDAFFDAVPTARDTMIAIEPNLYEMGAGAAYFDQYDLVLLAEPDEAAAIHEMSHVAQEHLNFPPGSRGTNPDAAGGFDNYWNNYGEVEARDAADTMHDKPGSDTPELLEVAQEEGIDERPMVMNLPSINMGMG